MSIKDYVHQIPNLGLQKPTSVWQRIHIDPILMLLLGALIVAGLFILYSADGAHHAKFNRQIANLAVGWFALIITAQFDPRWFKRYSAPMYLLGVILLLWVIFFGISRNGSQRWIMIAGVFQFQPSEIAKLAVPLFVATYLSNRAMPPRFKHLIVSLVIVLVPTILINIQPDLGTSLLIAFSGLVVIFMAGLSWWIIGGAVVSMAIALPAFWLFLMKDYQKVRVLTVFNPEADAQNAGWNTIQATTAIGSGGVEGKGYLAGTQSQLEFVPFSHTDFILSVLAEEFGFIGFLVVLLLYLLIVARGFQIAINAEDKFGRFLATSITCTFFIYVFVNMGMVSGILPVVGVPLPLISYGGTSVVTLLVGFGLLMSIATHRKIP